MQGDALLRTCGSLVFPFRCCLPLCLRGAACLHILVCLLGVLLMLLLSVFGQGVVGGGDYGGVIVTPAHPKPLTPSSGVVCDCWACPV
jgi:hypothetical protein